MGGQLFMKKLMLVCCLLCGSTQIARAVDYDPSDETLQKAIDYGKKGKGRDFNSFRREWFRLVGVHETSVNFVLQTPFFRAADEARDAAIQYNNFSISDAKRAVAANTGTLAVVAMTHANASTLEDMKLLIKVGDNVVHPSSELKKEVGNGLAGIEATFNEIPPDAKITVLLIKNNKEIKATYDLKKVR
jgi:hypothetical protein